MMWQCCKMSLFRPTVQLSHTFCFATAAVSNRCLTRLEKKFKSLVPESTWVTRGQHLPTVVGWTWTSQSTIDAWHGSGTDNAGLWMHFGLLTTCPTGGASPLFGDSRIADVLPKTMSLARLSLAWMLLSYSMLFEQSERNGEVSPHFKD